MALKRPGNSRNDQSGRSSTRASKPGNAPRRASAQDRNSSSGPGKSDFNKPTKKYSSERGGEKRSFSSSGNKPFEGRRDNDRSSSSFSGGAGERKPFSAKSKPYTGRPTDNNDRPKRTYGGDASGEKRSFAPKSRPYSGRVADNDHRPNRSRDNYRGNAESTGDRKFSSRPTGKSSFKKHEGDRSYSADRPQRSKSIYDKTAPDQEAPAKTLRGRKKGVESKDSGLIRLNRYISNAGICSRRKADELIAAGVVSVNGVVISELGHKVDPQKDEIRYNGETLKREKMVYVLLNKPKDYITTTDDPQERRTVMHLVEKASKERIYPIGRLDRNTTGLLLMTNDGDLADKLSHPRNNIVKLYQVELNKGLTQGDLNKISFGLELEDGLIKPDSISYVAGGSKREIGIQIHSGKNRIVRRIFEHLGYEVVKLDRAVYANLTKKDLPRGRWRYLEESEVIQLKHLI
jgi:23S rRNA pseudouridine2605 synthase